MLVPSCTSIQEESPPEIDLTSSVLKEEAPSLARKKRALQAPLSQSKPTGETVSKRGAEFPLDKSSAIPSNRIVERKPRMHTHPTTKLEF